MPQHNGNGYIKIPVFVTVIALVATGITASFGFALNRSDSVRVELKQDMEKMEDRIVREVRQIRVDQRNSIGR